MQVDAGLGEEDTASMEPSGIDLEVPPWPCLTPFYLVSVQNVLLPSCALTLEIVIKPSPPGTPSLSSHSPPHLPSLLSLTAGLPWLALYLWLSW